MDRCQDKRELGDSASHSRWTSSSNRSSRRSLAPRHQAVTAEGASRLSGYPGTWTVKIRSGNVGRELLAAADADLVVVGHRRHRTVRDAVLGSVAASTVHHSNRSVLVAVPPS